jgi:hypothetical protein
MKTIICIWRGIIDKVVTIPDKNEHNEVIILEEDQFREFDSLEEEHTAIKEFAKYYKGIENLCGDDYKHIIINDYDDHWEVIKEVNKKSD